MAKKTGRGKSWCPSSVDLLLLKNHVKPTGDPDCPSEVQRAKRIQREIDTSVNEELDETDAFDEATPPTQPAPLDEAVGESLSDSLKRGRDAKDTSAGLLTYTAKKRRSIDKYIEGAAEAESKATSDMMTLCS
ncbi:Aste57867_24605 [Aphanomyces stellatus]|uniref:Aste57867_24605 protein n=1 Tax=Aphanomyces stellatus TaxID=120398 RepID=A0A485LQT9_9STRA|nr:hypothetical protein As57867_024527 [Aphanomyces stellatus]VFU01243.1 Aste57867_24605 [Aphanomyces stellatus]